MPPGVRGVAVVVEVVASGEESAARAVCGGGSDEPSSAFLDLGKDLDSLFFFLEVVGDP